MTDLMSDQTNKHQKVAQADISQIQQSQPQISQVFQESNQKSKGNRIFKILKSRIFRIGIIIAICILIVCVIFFYTPLGKRIKVAKLWNVKQRDSYNDFGMQYYTAKDVPQNRKVTVVITSCCKRYDLLNLTLFTFFKMSTFPYDSIVIVYDGQIDKEFIDLIHSYSYQDNEITILETGKKVGQVKAIDMAYALVETPYIFHLQEDWQVLQKGFIQESINWFQNDPKIVQVWTVNKNHKFHEGTRIPISGFSISFTPGLKKLADYKQMGTYSAYTKQKTLGTGAGTAQIYIAKYYLDQGRYAVETQTQYTRHLGDDRGQGRYKGDI